jgi:ElaB/YqjD/DUF883 family membrane-anchored ribosome-binding protein
MDNTQREIRNEIEATRQDMVEKIATLESRVDSTIQGVKRSVDPKYQTQQHPWLMIGLSIAVGYVFSGLILGRPAPKAKLVLPDDWNERFPAKHRNTGMLQSLTGMLSGVVTATAVSLARDFASRTLFKSSSNGQGNGHDPNAPTNGEQRMATYSR